MTTALRDVVHDLRSSLGSIRLVLTSVLDEPDASIEDVRPLLVGAEAETRRLAATIAAVPALVEAAMDHERRVITDLGVVLDAAVADARRRDVHVSVSGRPGQVALAPTAPGVLSALCGITAGDTNHVDLIVTPDGLVLRRADGTAPRVDSAAVRHLASALGAAVDDDDATLRLRFASE